MGQVIYASVFSVPFLIVEMRGSILVDAGMVYGLAVGVLCNRCEYSHHNASLMLFEVYCTLIAENEKSGDFICLCFNMDRRLCLGSAVTLNLEQYSHDSASPYAYRAYPFPSGQYQFSGKLTASITHHQLPH